jgi:hypothetical protein
MEPQGVDQQAEELLRSMVGELTGPRAGECLACYVDRMLAEFGCDGKLRFALRYRDLRAPRASALARRLGQIGGFCDCEIFLNGWILKTELALVQGEEPVQNLPRPACQHVRAGSTKPCINWARQPRYGVW